MDFLIAQAKFHYFTHKPSDYPMPYGTLEKNGVAFQAMVKEENKIATFLVCASSCHGKLSPSFLP